MSLTHLVPHAPPMLLVDEVVSHDATGAHLRTTVVDGRPFATAEGWAPCVGMELIAQAAAVHRGLQQAEGTPSEGFLVGVPQMVLDAAPAPIGAVLDVHVRTLWGGDAGLTTVEGEVKHGDRVVATGRVQVFVRSEEGA